MSIDTEWDFFRLNGFQQSEVVKAEIDKSNIPKATELYISTITKIIYLSHPIDIFEVFWKCQVINYDIAMNGIIKKQIKLCSHSIEELNDIKTRFEKEERFKIEEVLIDGVKNNHLQFKDVRKISIGLSKKDLRAKKIKQKSAFYNCFVICLRVYIEDYYHELHIKIFNTGKLEIPGIKSNAHIKIIMNEFQKVLSDIGYEYGYSEVNDTVLMNSNFHCGFYINREKLHRILKYKYNINNGYDPCSYPGIQCKYYYYPALNDDMQDGRMRKDYECEYKVSFMIFRTGSILIVGKVTEKILYKIYNNIKKIIEDEFDEIFVRLYERKDKRLRKNKVIEIDI